MDAQERGFARRLELHEAEAWALCVEATRDAANNPLLAEVDRDAATPLSTLAALNFAKFNRVIALGVDRPATDSDIERLLDFYASRSQTRFAVEVTPVSEPDDLSAMLRRRALVASGDRVAKCWRSLEEVPSPYDDVEVKLLTVDDVAQYNVVSTAAWGVPRLFGTWFGATLGREGFRHYGVFDGELLVSTVAMYISGDLAWTGFGVTKPEYQGRGYQGARVAKELYDAKELGCKFIHNEAAAGEGDTGSISLRNMSRAGFHHIYTKDVYQLAT